MLDYATRISRSVLGRCLGRLDPRFHISRDLSVESGLKVSEAGPGSVRVLRPNSGSDFQYRPVLDVRSVRSFPRSNLASTRPGCITACTPCRTIIARVITTIQGPDYVHNKVYNTGVI